MSQPTFAVVGHPNKGKSSIVATLAHDPTVRVGPDPGTTTLSRAYPMTIGNETLYVLIDTPGFQRSRKVLEWMKARETTAAKHPEVVKQFVEDSSLQQSFPDEYQLLKPIVEGAGILYVVDGAVPFGPEYEAEMEILRWTGRPRLALINPIGSDTYVAEWRAALEQYFSVVRVFDAVTASFPKRLELLSLFGELDELWRPALDKAVTQLRRDRENRLRQASDAISNALTTIITL
ncbi:MAG: DUF3482 domain-containing protein, partial [Bdellovibrionales bacterium]|nr:DUF3482 domain-containing protein [Bdellovibrionales bacterium]